MPMAPMMAAPDRAHTMNRPRTEPNNLLPSPPDEFELLRALLGVRAGLIAPERFLQGWAAFQAGDRDGLGSILPVHGSGAADLIDELTSDELSLRRGNPRQAIAALLREPLPGEAEASLDTVEFRAWLRSGTASVANALPAPAPADSATAFSTVAKRKPAVSAATDVGEEVEGLARMRIVRLVHKGRRSEVHLAHDLDLDRQVVLRILNPGPSADPDARADFLREAEIVGRLEHPGIPPIYRLGFLADGRPYYTTCSLAAEPLSEVIDRFRNPPEARSGREAVSELRGLIGRFVDACRALAYAHGRGVVHCGLAPDSIVVGHGGETQVVEWGRARSGVGTASPSSPRQGTGTGGGDDDQNLLLSYASPEQLEAGSDRVGPAADVYAMGALLYLALAGRPPFEAGDPRALRERILDGRPTRPTRLSRGVSRALEAICLKAMARRPEHRYASMRLLALDLERWRLGEPVSVHREAARTRVGKLLGRWPMTTLTLAFGGMVAAAAGIHLYDRNRLASHDRIAHAEGLAEALATADLAEVEGLINRMGGDRGLASRRLRELADAKDSSERTRRQAALALLPEDPERADVILKAMLAPETAAGDFLILSRALGSHGVEAAMIERIWASLDLNAPALTPAGLRTAAALARFAPQDGRWEGLGPKVADALLREPAPAADRWTETFLLVANRIKVPLLDAYRDASREPRVRQLAYRYSLGLASRSKDAGQTEYLAELLCDADPAQFKETLALIAQRGRAASHLAAKIQHPITDDDQAERRQGQIAAALLILDSGDAVWPLLRHSADPTIRVEALRRFAELGGSPGVLVERLAAAAQAGESGHETPAEPEDPGILQALLLGLGGFDPSSLSPSAQEKVRSIVAELHRSHADPGVHSAAAWLFRAAWKQPEWLPPGPAAERGLNPARSWYEGPEGLTFAVVRGPVSAQLGSPTEEFGREAGETLHQVKIERKFAVSATEIPISLYRRFLSDDEGRNRIVDYSRGAQAQQTLPSEECPYIGANWYEAARFCNWMSRREGLPPAQWCYPADIGPGSAVPADAVLKGGYRLPTEAEWTYAARAGNLTAYATGLSSRRLDLAAWSTANSADQAHPVGHLLPNALGLFDTSGNASEWTHTAFRPYVIERLGTSGTDIVREPAAGPGGEAEPNRVVRGGAWNDETVDLRIAARRAQAPSARGVGLGFRIARTLP